MSQKVRLKTEDKEKTRITQEKMEKHKRPELAKSEPGVALALADIALLRSDSARKFELRRPDSKCDLHIYRTC